MTLPRLTERLRAVAHESTHQLESLLWEKDGAPSKTALFERPGWVVEGLAVLMGEGLDPEWRHEATLAFRIPRERLHQLKRSLASDRPYPVAFVLGCGIREMQMDPTLYAYVWSLAQFFLLSGEDLQVSGKRVPLASAFGRFFLENTARGTLAADGPGGASLALARALGATPSDASYVLDAFEQAWRAWVNDLEAPPIGTLEGSRFRSSELGVGFTVPDGYEPVPDDELEAFEVARFRKGADAMPIYADFAASSDGEHFIRYVLGGEATLSTPEPVEAGPGLRARTLALRSKKRSGAVLEVTTRRKRLFFILPDDVSATNLAKSGATE